VYKLPYRDCAPLNVDAKGGEGRINQDILPALNAQRGTCWTLYSSSFIDFLLLAPQCFRCRLLLSIGLLPSFSKRHAPFEQTAHRQRRGQIRWLHLEHGILSSNISFKRVAVASNIASSTVVYMTREGRSSRDWHQQELFSGCNTFSKCHWPRQARQTKRPRCTKASCGVTT